MDLRRVDLDERTRQEIRLLLVVALERHGVTRLEQRLQGLDDRCGLQHTALHPRREPGQSRGLPRPAARPTVRLVLGPSGRIHADTSQNNQGSIGASGPIGHRSRHDMDSSPF